MLLLVGSSTARFRELGWQGATVKGFAIGYTSSTWLIRFMDMGVFTVDD